MRRQMVLVCLNACTWRREIVFPALWAELASRAVCSAKSQTAPQTVSALALRFFLGASKGIPVDAGRAFCDPTIRGDRLSQPLTCQAIAAAEGPGHPSFGTDLSGEGGA